MAKAINLVHRLILHTSVYVNLRNEKRIMTRKVQWSKYEVNFNNIYNASYVNSKPAIERNVSHE